MAFDINELRSAMNSFGGFSKTSKFHVRIYPKNTSNSSYIARSLEFICDSATLPGLSWQTDELRMSGYGNIEKRPYSSIFQDVQTTFFCDSDGKVLEFFHKWMQSIYNFDSRAGRLRSTGGIKQNLFNYPDEYVGQVEITHFDDLGDEIVMYTLNDAYPLTVGDVQVAWEQNDQLTKIPITFTYTSWTSETLDPGVVDDRLNARFESLNFAASRIDFGLALVHGLQIFKNPRPLVILGAVNTLASLI